MTTNSAGGETRPVVTETRGEIFVVTLNRPPANAIDAATSRQLGQVFSRFRDDPALRVAVLTGGTSRFFSAGWDLKAAARGEAPFSDFGVGGFGGLVSLPHLNKPVIAAVNGISAGGGFEMALAADMIICADTARLALPGATVGALPEAAAVLLRRRIPHYIAMELLLTGRWFTPEEAHRWGCCNAVVPAAELMAKTMDLAGQLVKGAPLVQAAVKEIARETETMSAAQAMDRVKSRQLPAVSRLYDSADFKEGARAFSEKREPRWTGE
jgi:crotonobetainyl-CoA hydratase